MNFINILKILFIITIVVNLSFGSFLLVFIEAGLHIAGLIADVARAPFSRNTKCGHGLGATCTVRVYNQITTGNTLHIQCKSADDTITKDVAPGDQMSFNFGLSGSLDIGPNTLFYCTVTMPGQLGSLTFDVYNGDAPLYDNHWYIRDEGIWLVTDPLEPRFDNTLFYIWSQDPDEKVRLYSAVYTLYQDRTEDGGGSGAQTTDVVQNDECTNVRPEWDDEASVVQVCDFDCVILWQWEGCRGETSRLQSQEAGCTQFELSFFEDRTSAVGGCHKKNNERPLRPTKTRSGRILQAFNNSYVVV